MSKPVNYYKYTKKSKVHNPHYKTHLIEIPARILCIGASGAGKTMWLLDFIHQMNDTFEEIIICLRSKHEPLYELLEEKCQGGIKFFENTIPQLDDFKKEPAQRLIVFDDLVISKNLQNTIADYYIRGRKFQFTCVYISQSFYAIPKLIRQQASMLILKKIGSDKDLKMIIREYSLGLDLDELFKLYKQCTQTKTDFLMLDLNNDEYKYRFNYTPMRTTHE